MFCPKCKMLMRPIHLDGKHTLYCDTCNIKKEEEITFKEKGVSPIIVTEAVEENLEALPKTDQICPVCSHRKAYWWLRQTRAADEPPTSFFKCEKCGHVWREYR